MGQAYFKLLALQLLAVVPMVLPSPVGTTTRKCRVLFDGRLSRDVKPSDFDKNSSIYDHQFVHGENQTWAEIVKFPNVPPSIVCGILDPVETTLDLTVQFDIPRASKAVEVTINDASIFLPGGDPPSPQFGFRRSELIPALNNGSDITVQGTTTFHWSIRNDPHRPLNFSHEYHPVWHETADFGTSEITFLTGKPFNQSFDPTAHDPKTLRLAGRQSNSPETTFFQTPFVFDVWHNFAVTLGWDSDLLTVYYSEGYAPLRRVAGPTFNNNSGGGQFHVGVFKLPTGELGIDVVHEGFQESGLNEGLLFGGIFIEDSSQGCITTA